MTDTNKTKVIFRKFRNDNSIIAFFPEIPADINGFFCESYMRIGQHSAADLQGLISQTKLASEIEYKDLHAELTSIGYNLEVIKRDNYKFYQVRKAELKRQTEA